jgi:hypothetical protein
MKKLYALVISALLMPLSLMGQVPNGINYQAIIRNTSGEIMPIHEVELEISILHQSVSGEEVFSEIHNVTTNLQGLVNITIGSINSIEFLEIDWSDPPYFISVTIDDTHLGTSQILSVPYALFANTAGKAMSLEYDNILNKPEFLFFWADRDGDGYGDPYSAIYAPFAPDGYVINSDDCNDNSISINPGEVEVVDGIDNDCDGFIDCDDPDIADTSECLDSDGDGTANEYDNCPDIYNPDQQDTDGDGLGDACDPDDDNDDVLDIDDNCPYVFNPDQQNTDGDGLGDACDPDDDNDGIMDAFDNCPLVPNQDQHDFDSDGIGDACDPDDDNDGILDVFDNCPYVYNPEQQDTDGDGMGDSCDPDIDNDGVLNEYDNCPYVFNPDQLDTDGNGVGDACDDEIIYCFVNGDCPVGFICSVEGICVPEPPEEDCSDGVDNDGDGFIDCDDPDCDSECGTNNDIDGDGVHNIIDNCPNTPNPDQLDSDGDGIGDACDNCPDEPNPGQQDSNGNGIGDACEGIVDMDEDGYPSDVDCNDNDPFIHPGADESCNGVDDDCDGEIDEDFLFNGNPLGYACDGNGECGMGMVICDPSGLLAICSSQDQATEEICDGKDNDCNGFVDDVEDMPVWYQDMDGDGFGNIDFPMESCIEPTGYVENYDDCDDENPDINPFAEEVTDGVDNNCDGQIDENEYPFWDDDEDGILNGVDNCPNVPNPDQSDLDGDGVGDVCDNCPTTANSYQYDSDLDNIGDACDPDKDNDGYDSEVDCEDLDPNINPGVPEVCDGVDQNCNGIVDEDAIDQIQWFADADGDGYGDPNDYVYECLYPSNESLVIGRVTNSLDCDDNDPSIHPEAEEIPGNAIDENCDGVDY